MLNTQSTQLVCNTKSVNRPTRSQLCHIQVAGQLFSPSWWIIPQSPDGLHESRQNDTHVNLT